MCMSFFSSRSEPRHSAGEQLTKKGLGVTPSPNLFDKKSVQRECETLVFSGQKRNRDDAQLLWHLFTFGWYLRRDLHLVVFAPLLPVSPLFFRQGRRHAVQTGDRLPGAG